DATHQDPNGNLLGSFYFNSLEDLEAGRPTTFSRTLTPRAQETSQVLGGVVFSDQLRLNPDLSFRFTLRADASRFGFRPERNPDVERVFGVRNDVVPHELAFSPSMSFTKTLGEAVQLTAID